MTTNATTIAWGTIRTWAVAVLQEQVEKLNKRAAKCGCVPLKLRVLRSYKRVTGKNVLGSDIVVALSDVEIEGVAPCISGWVLVAKLTPVEGGNFVKSIPGLDGDLDPKYRTIGMICDHCRSKRRRNDVFVIRHAETGEEKVVGRNCLADFCRTTDTKAMLLWADWTDKTQRLFDSDWEKMSGVRPTEPIEYWLETTSIVIRKLGWLGRGTAFETGCLGLATADTVASLHWSPDIPCGSKAGFCRKNDLYATGFDKNLVQKALKWIRSLTETTSDYLYNLKLACSRDYVDHESAGLVSSLIPIYQRVAEEEVQRIQLRKKVALREWIGELKQRLRDLKLTVLGTHSFESQYGARTLIRFTDEAENMVIWWATGDRTEEFESGKTVVVDATVKKHEDHEKFGKQTVVTRVTVKEVV